MRGRMGGMEESPESQLSLSHERMHSANQALQEAKDRMAIARGACSSPADSRVVVAAEALGEAAIAYSRTVNAYCALIQAKHGTGN
jgi:hypothetical protein